MNYLNLIKKELKSLNFQTLIDDYNNSKNPDIFPFNGTQIYCGRQGSGKTASAVHHVRKLKASYPKAIIVSNLEFTQLEALTFGSLEELKTVLRHIDTTKQYIRFHDMDELALALVNVNNDVYGVIFLIDEIHTYLNALDSKNIPMFIFTEISQQRKQHKCIIGTSQLFLRVAKPMREQCDNIIMCNTILGVFTIQRAYKADEIDQDYDGKLSGTLRRRGMFVQTRELRNSYDTYQKVVSSSEQFENIQKPTILQPQKHRLLSSKH